MHKKLKLMIQRNMKYMMVIGVAILALPSCSIMRNYVQPNDVSRELFREYSGNDSTNIATLPYDEIFRDSILVQLINEGISNNPELLIAFQRIEQAEAYLGQSRAAFWPSFGFNAGVSHSRFSDAQNSGLGSQATQFQLGVSSSWEIDIWGTLRSVKKANMASLLQTEAAAHAIQTRIVSDIASYYFQLLALDQQIIIAQQTVFNWDSTVITMQALNEAGSVTAAAVVQSEAQRHAAEVLIPDLKQQLYEIENALSILLGRNPGRINRGLIDAQQVIDELKAGVPLQLLANRPDVQVAEYYYRASFHLTNQARASFYPSLTITADGGLSALNIADLIDPKAIAANIAGGLLQPLFNRRQLRTQLEVAKAEEQAAYLNFENSLLIAGAEVSDALFLYHSGLEKISVRTKQIASLQLSVEYTQELLLNGYANYNEVITARQSLLSAELGSVNDHLQLLLAVVSLYRSLGGGWQNPPLEP